jgi:hypothetical protein
MFKDLMTVAVGCIFYNDAVGLARLIDSCWKHVDLIFCVDGPFRDFKKTKQKKLPPKSTDLSRDVVKRYPNAVLVDAPYLLEHQKRQVYLDQCKKYNIDYLMIVDADEYFLPESNWSGFAEERERVCTDDYIYNLKNYTDLQPLGLVPLDQARLWKNPGKLEYLNNHHYQFTLRNTAKALVAKLTLYTVKLCHDPMLIRSDERHEQHHKYIKWLEGYEKKKMRNESKHERKNRLTSVWGGN